MKRNPIGNVQLKSINQLTIITGFGSVKNQQVNSEKLFIDAI